MALFNPGAILSNLFFITSAVTSSISTSAIPSTEALPSVVTDPLYGVAVTLLPSSAIPSSLTATALAPGYSGPALSDILPSLVLPSIDANGLLQLPDPSPPATSSISSSPSLTVPIYQATQPLPLLTVLGGRIVLITPITTIPAVPPTPIPTIITTSSLPDISPPINAPTAITTLKADDPASVSINTFSLLKSFLDPLSLISVPTNVPVVEEPTYISRPAELNPLAYLPSLMDSLLGGGSAAETGTSSISRPTSSTASSRVSSVVPSSSAISTPDERKDVTVKASFDDTLALSLPRLTPYKCLNWPGFTFGLATSLISPLLTIAVTEAGSGSNIASFRITSPRLQSAAVMTTQNTDTESFSLKSLSYGCALVTGQEGFVPSFGCKVLVKCFRSGISGGNTTTTATTGTNITTSTTSLNPNVSSTSPGAKEGGDEGGDVDVEVPAAQRELVYTKVRFYGTETLASVSFDDVNNDSTSNPTTATVTNNNGTESASSDNNANYGSFYNCTRVTFQSSSTVANSVLLTLLDSVVYTVKEGTVCKDGLM